MKIKLNQEQLSYFKGLKKNKKKRAFLLDALLQNLESEIQISENIVFKDGIFKTSNQNTIKSMNAMGNNFLFKAEESKKESGEKPSNFESLKKYAELKSEQIILNKSE